MRRILILSTFIYKTTPAILLALAVFESPVLGQGCVQSRGASIGPLMQGEDVYLQAGQWQANVGYRWLHSDRHFSGVNELTGKQVGGGDENTSRSFFGDQIINDSHFIDVSATYAFTKRISASLTLPFVTSDRSQPVKVATPATANTPGTVVIYDRFSTHAGGLADMSVRVNGWVFDPHKCMEGNLQLGVGLKIPTGDSRARDVFESRQANGTIVANQNYVDQSIQPGDGGWGVILQASGFQKIVKNTYAYMDVSYLINPQEKDTATGYSTPDAYLLRAGLSYAIWPAAGLSLSLGGRMEGVPVTDWFGGSTGSRRPGYAISIEPGLTWVYQKWAFTVTAPVAIERNREKSVSDLASGRHGDAAFADFIITSSISYRF